MKKKLMKNKLMKNKSRKSKNNIYKSNGSGNPSNNIFTKTFRKMKIGQTNQTKSLKPNIFTRMFSRKPKYEKNSMNEEYKDAEEYEDAEDINTQNLGETFEPKIDIGVMYDKITNHFDNFQNFDYLTSVRKTGSHSVNGTVYNLNFIKNGKSASALIKTANKSHSDNLYYEYLVGTLFINKMCKIVPCFIQTHHILSKEDKYVLNESNIRDKMTYLSGLNDSELNNKQMDYLETSCKKSTQIGVMMQYIDSYETFFEYVNLLLPTFKVIESLFQIYCPLYYLQRNFTHYDLHAGNVLMSKLPEKTYIKMKYLTGKRTIEFKTDRIAKIIDYGRSFFSVGHFINSDKIANRVLSADDCIDIRTDKIGFGYGFMRCENAVDHFICSRRSNISHDLKLVAQYKYEQDSNDAILHIANKIVYDLPHGTKEIQQSVDDKNGDIFNIEDMTNYLIKHILRKDFQVANDFHYHNMTCIGELIIYVDKSKNKLTEMKFFPTNI
jgi:hypothetical protein